MDDWALTGRPWNLHVGQEGRRLKGKQEWFADMCACVCYNCALGDCVLLKHCRMEMADWSLHLCVITAALCICMPALEGVDEKCALFYNHNLAWKHTPFSFQQTATHASCIIYLCNKHFKTNTRNEISTRYHFDWKSITPGCLKDS